MSTNGRSLVLVLVVWFYRHDDGGNDVRKTPHEDHSEEEEGDCHESLAVRWPWKTYSIGCTFWFIVVYCVGFRFLYPPKDCHREWWFVVVVSIVLCLDYHHCHGQR